MKVAVIADTHFGAKNDDRRLLANQVRFFREVFFPEIERRGVEAIVHLGDLVDRRKFVQYQTAATMRREYLDRAAAYRHHILVGNHDCALRDTTEINALVELVGRDPHHHLHVRPGSIMLGSLGCLMLPWICAINAEESVSAIENTQADFCMAHLELSGFETYRGQVAEKGMAPKHFQKFDQVLTGHYHTMSSKGNIKYVGAPYEMKWNDYDDTRGFHILDTETREMEHVANPLTMHAKLRYDDGEADPDWASFEGKIVRLTVGTRENGNRFDRWMRELDQAGADVTVIEDRLAVTSLDELAQIKAGDTLQTMEAYVDETFVGADAEKSSLVSLLSEVYREALERQQ